MNTYEITFTRENGSTGKDRITAANEKQARKDFREIYRHSSATITDVIVAAENVPASKQQERDALDQIRAIVDTLGPDSYLATAFAGCFEDAEENIKNDFACSMKQRLESAEAKRIEAELGYNRLVDKLAESEKALEAARATSKRRTKKSRRQTLGSLPSSAPPSRLKSRTSFWPTSPPSPPCISSGSRRPSLRTPGKSPKMPRSCAFSTSTARVSSRSASSTPARPTTARSTARSSGPPISASHTPAATATSSKTCCTATGAKEVRHMKQGISIERTYDLHDRLIVRILKRRGRLTLEEVSDLLRLEGGGEWSGWYAVLLNCTEGTIGGNGLYDSDDPKGDAVDLYEINEGDDCPICGKFIPPFQYCPSCGAKWSDADQNVETLLASMMEETRRMIAASSKEDGRVAWYWSFIGSLDMARQLGLITEERRQELYEKAKEMKP